MTEATSATARDFEDVGSEFGDDAIREAVNAAGPKTVFPRGFTSRPVVSITMMAERQDRYVSPVRSRCLLKLAME